MSASHPEAVGGELLIIAVNPDFFVIRHSHGIVAPLQPGGVFDFRIDPLTQLTLGLDEIVTRTAPGSLDSSLVDSSRHGLSLVQLIWNVRHLPASVPRPR